MCCKKRQPARASGEGTGRLKRAPQLDEGFECINPHRGLYMAVTLLRGMQRPIRHGDVHANPQRDPELNAARACGYVSSDRTTMFIGPARAGRTQASIVYCVWMIVGR